MAETTALSSTTRLRSLDAFRGFVMLAMCSGGFALNTVVDNYIDPAVVGAPAAAGARGDAAPGGNVRGNRRPAPAVHENAGTGGAYWKMGWHFVADQFSHVQWEGCSFWDLIQPGFMFLVGASMPFSFGKRRERGATRRQLFGHVAARAAILIVLGVLIVSNGKRQTDFSFVNVLTQIGLGYIFVYLLLWRHIAIQLLALVAILAGYWYAFYAYTIPPEEEKLLVTYVNDVVNADKVNVPKDVGYLSPIDPNWESLARHWGKHTNAAADFDRVFLNVFPSQEPLWNGHRFWINRGGYQTLNFIPSIATMLLGLMAGTLLAGPKTNLQKFRRLLLAGFFLLAVGTALDMSIWPLHSDNFLDSWVLSPIVKRIWTPSWVLFSAGWVFVMLSAFYYLIEVKGHKRWPFFLEVVGLNSLAVYVMYQFTHRWIARTWEIQLRGLDGLLTSFNGLLGNVVGVMKQVESRLADEFFNSTFNPYAPILESLIVLFSLWLMAYWLYRRNIYVRV